VLQQGSPVLVLVGENAGGRLDQFTQILRLSPIVLRTIVLPASPGLMQSDHLGQGSQLLPDMTDHGGYPYHLVLTENTVNGSTPGRKEGGKDQNPRKGKKKCTVTATNVNVNSVKASRCS